MNQVTKNTIKRIASALVGLPLYFFGVITDKAWSLPILAVSIAISLACLYEYYVMTDRGEDGKAFMFEGMAVGFFINVFMYLFAYGRRYMIASFFDCLDPRGIIFFIVIIIAMTLFLQVFSRPIRGATYSLGVTVSGVIFIAGFFSHIILMKALTNGIFYIFILNVVVMMNDSGAYFGGVLFGRHKTDFPVSPNKTWEGYISGLVFSVLTMVLFNMLFESYFHVRLFPAAEAALLGVVLSFTANTGDLVESMMKRDNNVKDSGNLVPGHGGMWDVFDALIFSLPIFYYYLIFRGVV